MQVTTQDSFVDFEIGNPSNFQTTQNITGYPFFCSDDTTYSKVGKNSPLLGKGKDGVKGPAETFLFL